MIAENGFKIIYCGTDAREAEKQLDNGGCYAVIYCDEGYGVAVLNEERAELRPETCIALELDGGAMGITLSADFCGRFAVCSGETVSALFRYYLNGCRFRSIHAKTVAQREAMHPRSIREAHPESVGLYDIHTVLHKVFGEVERAYSKPVSTAESIRIYLDNNLQKRITLQDIADTFFIGKTQIFRVFTAKYGISPIKYLIKKRIEASKRMLEATELKISEIAEALSFTDAKHYAKTFRGHTGMLPSEYRRSNARDADKGKDEV